MAPVNDEARRRNGNLPGMGGVFNAVNLHLYHYAGNNPIKYTDPDGREVYIQGDEKEQNRILNMINSLSKDQYRLQYGYLEKIEGAENKNGSDTYSKSINNLIAKGHTMIKISDTYIDRNNNERDIPGGYTDPQIDLVGAVTVYITGRKTDLIPTGKGYLKAASPQDILMHELAGHAEPYITGKDGNAIDIENKIRGEIYSHNPFYNPSGGIFNGFFKFRMPADHPSRIPMRRK
jgi:hypothetical protein